MAHSGMEFEQPSPSAASAATFFLCDATRAPPGSSDFKAASGRRGRRSIYHSTSATACAHHAPNWQRSMSPKV